MSGDFPEWDRRGLADWLDDCAGLGDGSGDGSDDVPGRRGVSGQGGGPAYVVSFGWIPAQPPSVQLPPVPLISAPLIPAPRRAGDDLPWDDPR